MYCCYGTSKVPKLSVKAEVGGKRVSASVQQCNLLITDERDTQMMASFFMASPGNG
jgi:hypothetical protein